MKSLLERIMCKEPVVGGLYKPIGPCIYVILRLRNKTSLGQYVDLQNTNNHNIYRNYCMDTRYYKYLL